MCTTYCLGTAVMRECCSEPAADVTLAGGPGLQSPLHTPQAAPARCVQSGLSPRCCRCERAERKHLPRALGRGQAWEPQGRIRISSPLGAWNPQRGTQRPGHFH